MGSKEEVESPGGSGKSQPEDLERNGLTWVYGFLYAWVLGVFTVGGAVMFMVVEGPSQKAAPCLETALGNLSRLASAGLDSADFRTAAKSVLAEHAACKSFPLGNWHNAVVYAVSIYTTIGYGVPAVTTWAGRAATFAYAVVGVPLFFGFHEDMCGRLYSAVVLTANHVRLAWRRWRSKRLSREQLSARPPLDDSRMSLRVALVAMLGSWAFMALSALTVYPACLNEDWDYADLFYYFFQSSYLIGFGEIYPSGQWKSALALVPIIPCVTVVSLAILPLQFMFKRWIAELARYAMTKANGYAYGKAEEEKLKQLPDTRPDEYEVGFVPGEGEDGGPGPSGLPGKLVLRPTQPRRHNFSPALVQERYGLARAHESEPTLRIRPSAASLLAAVAAANNSAFDTADRSLPSARTALSSPSLLPHSQTQGDSLRYDPTPTHRDHSPAAVPTPSAKDRLNLPNIPQAPSPKP